MNTNQLKKFAQEARRKLQQQVGAKLEFVLTHDTAELREKTTQVNNLKDELNRIGRQQLIDKVAYTWFNRLMALRFMDANDYQPSGLRIVSPKDGFTLPEILDEAKQGHFPEEIAVDKQKVLNILDREFSNNPQNEAYRVLLVAACNALNKQFPFLFERINDFTELLLPDDLTSEFSIVSDIVNGMTTDDCKQVEIIGWLYQFYISEKKDEVFASKGKVSKEDIPAATQLFTPRWIVEYMVQNTLGKLWIQNNPQSRLREHMPYFIESASLNAEYYLRVDSVEDIKLLDQACGSGHILVYAFELLTKIYEEEGYNPSDIPKHIIEKNLYGFEIDDRAAQLAGFSLLMKARGYYRRLFRKAVQPNILCFEDVKFEPNELENYLKQMNLDLFSQDLKADIQLFEQATNLGSLIQPQSRNLPLIEKQLPSSDIFMARTHSKVVTVLRHIELLAKKYHCVVANPPYMGGGKMNTSLSEFVKTNYPKAKSDLFSCFIEGSLNLIKPNGYTGLVTMESWMFLSSFEDFRKNIIENYRIHSLSHFGWHIMRIAFGTVSFILQRAKPVADFKGMYSYLEIGNIDKESERPKVFPIKDNGRYNYTNQNVFEKIPGSPIGYWVSDALLNAFNEGVSIKEIAPPKQGLATGNNNLFLKYWFEVEIKKINSRWIPINKGGSYRKWFGNNEYVVDWEDDGFRLKNYRDEHGKLRSRPQNQSYYFRKGLTWSTLSSSSASFRYSPEYHLFETKGSTLFPEPNDLYRVAAFLNSKIVNKLLLVLSPTLDYHEGPIGSLPYLTSGSISENLVEQQISISKSEWDSRELSWDFKRNELLSKKGQDIEESYDLYCQYWTNKFHKLHQNEEELNQQFIEIYSMQGELTPDVPLEDITILKEETSIDNGALVFHANEILAQFVSYAVGCMLGRYSLDKEGLILANQREALEEYLSKVGKAESEVSFLPDDDAIIPVLDDEWFEDDIVGRFYEFLKVIYGERDFKKNLAFVEEALGKDIRKYLVKDFYNDHIKRYKKRPIYWMFSSPKGSFNVLIYMHRYTPDTLNNILNNYLREFIQKLQSQKSHYERILVSGNTREQNQATKQIDNLEKMILDCEEYEREILYPLATERIPIDLDDGVLVNYNKFGKAVKEIKGLNDKKAKEKVRKFDWIDTSKII